MHVLIADPFFEAVGRGARLVVISIKFDVFCCRLIMPRNLDCVALVCPFYVDFSIKAKDQRIHDQSLALY